MNPSATPAIAISVVIPVYNEQDVLQALFDRLYAVLDEDVDVFAQVDRLEHLA